jgi:hypothetical protein
LIYFGEGDMQGPSEEKERPNYANLAGSTGGRTEARIPYAPFYGVQTSWLNDKSLTGYGWDPKHTANVVRIVYRPLNEEGKLTGEPTVVAGYISVVNVNLDEFLQDNKFRIGVDVTDVIDAIATRCNMLQELIKKALDEGSLERAKELEVKLDVLEIKLSELRDLMDVGVNHIVLATGWREIEGEGKFVDRLDLNSYFFKNFYPKEAFPIGNEAEGQSWVNRDFFLWQLFPEGEIVYPCECEHGLGQWRIGKSDSQRFPNLKIIFDHSDADVWDENLGETEKLGEKWLAVSELVERLEQEIQKNPSGVEAKKARWRAMRWGIKLQRLARELRKDGKQEAAQKNENGAQRLFIAVKNSHEKEQDSLISDLTNIGDTTGKDFIKKSRKVDMGIRDVLSTQGDEDGKLAKRTIDCLLEKYEDRAEKLFERLEKTSPTEPKYGEYVVELMKSLDSAFSMRESGEAEQSIARISDRLIEKSTAALEKRYNLDPMLDKEMKRLIRIHVLFLHCPLPRSLRGDKKIEDYQKMLLSASEERPARPQDPEIVGKIGKEIKGEFISSERKVS